MRADEGSRHVWPATDGRLLSKNGSNANIMYEHTRASVSGGQRCVQTEAVDHRCRPNQAVDTTMTGVARWVIGC
jgi:hypothetical protein